MRTVKLLNRVPWALLALLAACGGEDELVGGNGGGPAPAPAPTMAERLINAQVFSIDPCVSRTEVTAVEHMGQPTAVRVALPVESGTLRIRARPDGRVAIDALSMTLQSVAVEPGPGQPMGFELTALRLEGHDGALGASWHGDLVTGHGTLDLALEGTLVSASGRRAPMASQPLAALDCSFALVLDGDRPRLQLVATHAGAVWHWQDLLELRDASLTLDARAGEPAAAP